MKAFFEFLRTTVMGGLLFLLPIVVLIILLGKALSVTQMLVEPVAARVPVESALGLRTPLFLSIAVLVLFSFMAGLLARVAFARRIVSGLETTVLSNLPGYEYFKSVGASVLGIDKKEKYPVVFAAFDDYWQLAFQIDRLDNGIVVVYIPGSPNPRSGGVYFMTPDRIRPTGVTMGSMLKCVKCLGAGAKELLGGISLEGAQDAEQRG